MRRSLPRSPICTDDGRCVECETSDQCEADAPVCDVVAGVCEPCTEHAECVSEVCLIDEGTCASAGDIIYVDPDGTDGSSCGGPADACATVSGDAGASAQLTETRRIIRLRPGNYTEAVVLNSVEATIVGPGATITPPAGSGDLAMEIAFGGDLVLDGLTLANASGGNLAHGLSCTSATLLARNVTMENNEGNGFFHRCAATVRDVIARGNAEHASGSPGTTAPSTSNDLSRSRTSGTA